MEKEQFMEMLSGCPVIAAVKDDGGVEKCLKTDCKIVFVLYGTVMSVCDIVSKLKKGGKTVFVHLDLIEGLSSKEISVDFLAENTEIDGIISTRQAMLRRAKQKGLFTIQRFFLLDSMAINNIQKQLSAGFVDIIEVLPGLMPKIITKISQSVEVPIVAGGLISDGEDVTTALNAGAAAISTTNQDIWSM